MLRNQVRSVHNCLVQCVKSQNRMICAGLKDLGILMDRVFLKLIQAAWAMVVADFLSLWKLTCIFNFHIGQTCKATSGKWRINCHTMEVIPVTLWCNTLMDDWCQTFGMGQILTLAAAYYANSSKTYTNYILWIWNVLALLVAVLDNCRFRDSSDRCSTYKRSDFWSDLYSLDYFCSFDMR